MYVYVNISINVFISIILDNYLKKVEIIEPRDYCSPTGL